MDIRIIDKKSHIILFSPSTGYFERKVNFETDLVVPDLLDISLTNYCSNNCSFCYRKSNLNGKHIDVKLLYKLLDSMNNAGIVQIAYGGGNPNQHPDFIQIIKNTREKYKIVPNYSTNGIGLTDDILKATKKYCGAVAVSMYEDEKLFQKSLEKMHLYDIKVNVHIMISADNAREIYEKIKKNISYFKTVNSVVLLNYKPLKISDNVKKIDKNDLLNIINFLSNNNISVAFDVCFSSYVAKLLDYELNIECDAGKYSAFISEDLKLYPCSFLTNSFEGISLVDKTFLEALTDVEYKKFRNNKFNKACTGCKYQKNCNGGCKVFDINYCK